MGAIWYDAHQKDVPEPKKMTFEDWFALRFNDNKDKKQLGNALADISTLLGENLKSKLEDPRYDPNRTAEKKLYALAKFVRAHDFFRNIKTEDRPSKYSKTEATKSEDPITKRWHAFADFDRALGDLERGSKDWKDPARSTALPHEVELLLQYLGGQSRV